MQRITLCRAAVIAAVVISGNASAQSNRTFVSGQGADTGSCSLSAPCRSFAYAVTQTNPNGELAVLDTAGYGTVTITQPISITNEEGVEAGITTASSVVGITITATGVVNLRGLTLTGGNVGTSGITFSGSGTLNIQNCVIRGFSGDGIDLVQTGASNVTISDTIVSNNGVDEVFVRPTGSGTISLSLERVQLLGGGAYGIDIDATLATGGSLQAGVSDSLASGNGAGGYLVGGGAAMPATLTIINSRAYSNTSFGLGSENATGTLIMSQATTAGNTKGYAIFAGGTIKTYGNNNITETVNSGSLTSIAAK